MKSVKLILITAFIAFTQCSNAQSIQVQCDKQFTNYSICNFRNMQAQAITNGQNPLSQKPVSSVQANSGDQSSTGQVPIAELLSASASSEKTFVFGPQEERLVSCTEWNNEFLNNSALGKMENPQNVPGTKITSVIGEIEAVADSEGWNAVKIYSMKGVFLGYGAALVQRQAAYLNGSFDHWVSGNNNNGWVPARVGFCGSKINQ